MTVLLLLGMFFASLPATIQAQDPPNREERFFDWARMTFPATEYANRRETLVAALMQRGGGVFLAPSEFPVGGPTFRQLDNFLYFTGLELPSSILVVDADAKETLVFAPRRDERFEQPSRVNDFPGRPLADDPSIATNSGIARIEPFGEFENYLERLSEDGRTIWIDFGSAAADPVRNGARSIEAQTSQEIAVALFVQNRIPGAVIQNAYEIVASLRMVKSEAEVAVMRRAAEISAHALSEAASHVGEGIDERRLEAEFEVGCKRGGAQRLAFPSIIKSGPNSLWPWRILATHYDRRNRTMHDGDLVIFDVGCELDHYASDMGRTFPISGTFTDDQRELLRWVTGVADSIIAAVKPGVTFRQLTEVAARQIPTDQRQYMQTGLYYGHHLGLSSGDPSLADAPLAPGMIFTVEPWYYNHDTDVAVFVEDEVLVTEDGAEVLTTQLPRTPEELERLVGVVRQ
jgi:Xaa-Pro aminopeptidase